MINAKVEVVTGDSALSFQNNLNGFLVKIDVRQIIKTEHFQPDRSFYRAIIYYVNFEDVRDAKIDSIIKLNQLN